MTDEEALDWLESRKEHYELDDNCQELAKALDIGIKALKNQKSVITELEKIKTEIKSHDHGYWGADAGHREDVKIIDKHISELKGEQE